MLTAGNKALQDSGSRLVYYTRVSIQNPKCSYFQERDCGTEEEFFKLVEEVADSVYDDKNFYINILCKGCDWNFNDGKATIHWADPQIGKMMTVHLMIQLHIDYQHI